MLALAHRQGDALPRAAGARSPARLVVILLASVCALVPRALPHHVSLCHVAVLVPLLPKLHAQYYLINLPTRLAFLSPVFSW